MSLFDLSQIPIYTKFLAGPILDKFYSKKFGKRMTYIFPISILLVSLFLWLSKSADKLMTESQGVGLALPLFVGMTLVSIQDLAIDALCEECLEK